MPVDKFGRMSGLLKRRFKRINYRFCNATLRTYKKNYL